MGKRNDSQTIRCEHFTWKMFKRGTVYYADGRKGTTNLGKHSLNAKTEEEALKNLQRLDEKKARELGLIPKEPPTSTAPDRKTPLSIADGWTKFLAHCDRPIVMGGVSPDTLKRYRAVRDKHIGFCKDSKADCWSKFDSSQAEKYGRWLEENDYASRTIRMEVTLVISVVKWLIDQELLDANCRIHVSLTRPTGRDTHCFTRQQMTRMLEHCLSSPLGRWIRPILITLATTGMRIGELISLRWSDIDFTSGSIRIMDERFSRRKEIKGRVRTTKGKRSRTVPLSPQLRAVLVTLPRHPDGLLFHGVNGVPLRDKRVLDVFKREIREPLKGEFPVTTGEVGFQHGTIHSFRHFFVSEAFRQGATEAEIMDWVGHRSSEMVHHYRHLRPDDSQRRMQSINFISDDTVSPGNQPEPEVPRESKAG